jgi:hypothetical protein
MSSVAATKMIAEIHPARVRYIKLVSAGHWGMYQERNCSIRL